MMAKQEQGADCYLSARGRYKTQWLIDRNVGILRGIFKQSPFMSASYTERIAQPVIDEIIWLENLGKTVSVKKYWRRFKIYG